MFCSYIKAATQQELNRSRSLKFSLQQELEPESIFQEQDWIRSQKFWSPITSGPELISVRKAFLVGLSAGGLIHREGRIGKISSATNRSKIDYSLVQTSWVTIDYLKCLQILNILITGNACK